MKQLLFQNPYLVRSIFKLCSYIPLIWITTVYLFLFSAIVDLGHFPKPSINDPKHIGSQFLYLVVWYGFIPMLISVLVGMITLIVSLVIKAVSTKHVAIFLLGVTTILVQIFIDPGDVLYWYMD